MRNSRARLVLAGMAYSFKPDRETLQDGLRRIACDQIDSGLDEARRTDLPTGERIHQVRKRCKKLRGLVRLVRPGFEDYSQENAAFRDAAGALSDLRDARTLVETCDRLGDRFGHLLKDDALIPLRDELSRRAEELETSDAASSGLETMHERLSEARERAESWTLHGEASDIVAAGVAKTHGRAVAAMEDAQSDRDPELLHDWRKRAKYHWYHMRLLKQTGAGLVDAAVDLADDLSETLGDHHDLHVLAATLDTIDIDKPRKTAIAALISERQKRLEADAFRAGRILFAEKSNHVARRMARYWKVAE